MTEAVAHAVGPPPRSVASWTRVPGHQVIGRTRAFCECGARQQARDRATFDDWRTAHLSNAWPILVPRRGSETLEKWFERVEDELREATVQEQDFYSRDGLDSPVPPGGAFPVMSAAYMAACDRVEVLERQLQDIRAKSLDLSE